jgi:epoxide hydrolase-like predicted phosphatase
MNQNIKALFIDNAGVLYQTDWANQFSNMLGRSVSEHELHQTWANCKSIVEYECGQLSHAAFINAFKQEINSPLSHNALSRCFEAILTTPFTQSIDVLTQLKQDYSLWLLCNSNDNHWQQHISQSGYLELFDGVIASQQIGIMKPDQGFFNHALERSGFKPHEVIFFDDGKSNVAAANNMGIQAHLVNSPEQIVRCVPNISNKSSHL